jgi:hypothetical protein
MVEYSWITHALLVIGFGFAVGVGQYLQLFEAINTYLDSIYTVVSMGAV